MDDVGETNSLSELLGTSKVPELTSSSSQAYLSYLTTLPLHNLLSEPSLLQTQSHHLTSSLTSLTHTSYPTFISLHDTTTALSTSLDSLSTSLDSLISDSLPALEDSASNWRQRTETVLGERRKARVVLEQHDKIRDLLDIPLLIDTCVRNGFFSEALSLASHATSLYSSSPAPPLILTSIITEVRHSITQMLFSLLGTLHEPNRKLPALWKAVNFLRKMEAFDFEEGVFPEEQIALAFITGREACLKSSLEGFSRDINRLVGMPSSDTAAKEDLAASLKKYIETWREGVNDIISHYTTIFLERPASTSAPASKSVTPSLQPLLATYASHALQRHLLPLLRNTLPHIPLSSLSTIHDRLAHCATAFARVGLDFRGVLGDVCSHAVLRSVQDEMREVTANFVALLKQKTGRPTSSQLRNSTPPSEWAITASAAASPPKSSAPSKSLHVPPHVLASYPPVARYTNALLSLFNDFRKVASVAIASTLRAELDSCLAEAGEALLRYVKNVVGQSDAEARIGEALGMVFFAVFMPFVRRAFGEGLYQVKEDYTAVEGEDTSLSKTMREWEGWLETYTGG
ncbi:Dor1-domain-containing protein [Hymenopellis radicata]|nr:Dor1-domain-containing protein [Hymenopellis radicata]